MFCKSKKKPYHFLTYAHIEIDQSETSSVVELVKFMNFKLLGQPIKCIPINCMHRMLRPLTLTMIWRRICAEFTSVAKMYVAKRLESESHLAPFILLCLLALLYLIIK